MASKRAKYLVTTPAGKFLTSTLAEAKAVERAGGVPAKRKGKNPAKRRNPYPNGVPFSSLQIGDTFKTFGDKQDEHYGLPSLRHFKSGANQMRQLVYPHPTSSGGFDYGGLGDASPRRGDDLAYDVEPMNPRPTSDQLHAIVMHVKSAKVKANPSARFYWLRDNYPSFEPFGLWSLVEQANKSSGKAKNPAKRRNPAGGYFDAEFWAGEVLDDLARAIMQNRPEWDWDPSSGEFYSEGPQLEVQLAANADGSVSIYVSADELMHDTAPLRSTADVRKARTEAVKWANAYFKRGNPAAAKYLAGWVAVTDRLPTAAEVNAGLFIAKDGKLTKPLPFRPAVKPWSDDDVSLPWDATHWRSRLKANPIGPAQAVGLLVRMHKDKASTFARKVAWMRKHMPGISDPQAFVAELVRAGGEKVGKRNPSAEEVGHAVGKYGAKSASLALRGLAAAGKGLFGLTKGAAKGIQTAVQEAAVKRAAAEKAAADAKLAQAKLEAKVAAAPALPARAELPMLSAEQTARAQAAAGSLPIANPRKRRNGAVSPSAPLRVQAIAASGKPGKISSTTLGAFAATHGAELVERVEHLHPGQGVTMAEPGSPGLYVWRP